MPTTIVFVDEDDVTRILNARILRQAGFRVIEQRNAERIVALLIEEQPALVLLDRGRGQHGESGFVASARIRATPQCAGVRIAIVAGQSTFDDMRFAAIAGAERVLRKPISPDAIFRMLDLARRAA